jgi:divalent metal cation (Fe/Co/Zn/Cd) transporter
MATDHGSSAKAILYAFFANLGIAITKTAAAIYTNSGSMLAEAIHSYADCANQVLLYLGIKQSEKPPTSEHPLGYGKVTYFWSFVVALLLFSIGGLFSIYEGWHKLHEPEPLNKAWVALLVLAIAIVLEAVSLVGCLNEIRKIRRGRPFDWLKHTCNPARVCWARTSRRRLASSSRSCSSGWPLRPATRATTRRVRLPSESC